MPLLISTLIGIEFITYSIILSYNIMKKNRNILYKNFNTCVLSSIATTYYNSSPNSFISPGAMFY